jgi:hypothetical protein
MSQRAGLGWQWNSRLLNLTSNWLAAYRHLMWLRSSLLEDRLDRHLPIAPRHV